LQVSEYNKRATKYPLLSYGRSRTLGVVIGSTKDFWPSFVKYAQNIYTTPAQPDEPAAELPKDPIDAFHELTVRKVATEVCEMFHIPHHEARYDWNPPRSGKFVHIQTAGHVAGFAFYDQAALWSCHKDYGLWFAYRAVVVFDIEYAGANPEPPKPILEVAEIEAIKRLTAKADSEQWQNRKTRLDIRDCCKSGSQWRYSGDCLDYFFPINTTTQAVLKKIRESTPKPTTQDVVK